MKALRTLQKFPDTFVPLGLQPLFPILSIMTPDFAIELNLHIIFMKKNQLLLNLGLQYENYSSPMFLSSHFSENGNKPPFVVNLPLCA